MIGLCSMLRPWSMPTRSMRTVAPHDTTRVGSVSPATSKVWPGWPNCTATIAMRTSWPV